MELLFLLVLQPIEKNLDKNENEHHTFAPKNYNIYYYMNFKIISVQ